MSEYHESLEELDGTTKDLHRALKSLQEELEAVDWYQQRIAVADNSELREILAHNRDEEIEHAAMLLEWLRRNMSGWQDELEAYLFTEVAIAHADERHDDEESPSSSSGSALGIGGMKGDS